MSDSDDEREDAARLHVAPRRLWLAYLLWAACPVYPLYAFYLGRDEHCWLYAVTGGGFGVGWLLDGCCLPWFVADHNEPVGYEKRARERFDAMLSPLSLLAPVRWALLLAIGAVAAAPV